MLSDIRNRVEESKRLNGVFGPQAQDDLEYMLDLVDRLGKVLNYAVTPSRRLEDTGAWIIEVDELLKEIEGEDA
jgi:hypothetical protein